MSSVLSSLDHLLTSAKTLGSSTPVYECCVCSYGVCGHTWRPEVTVGSHQFGIIGSPRSPRDPLAFFPNPQHQIPMHLTLGVWGARLQSSCKPQQAPYPLNYVPSLFLGLLNQEIGLTGLSRVCLQILDQHKMCGFLPRKGKWLEDGHPGLIFSRKVLSSLRVSHVRGHV